MDQFVIKQHLQSGTFGVVYICEEKSSHRSLACKTIKKIDYPSDYCPVEVELAQKHSNIFQNPCIVPFMGTIETDKEWNILMPLMEGGDLYDLINSEGPLSERRARGIFLNIVKAMAHLHDNHIVHRDIKPENILFADSKKQHAVLADFGNCSFLYNGLSFGYSGTDGYIAPEVLNTFHSPSSCYTSQCDLYSLGCTLHAMILSEIPEKPDNNSQYGFNFLDPFWFNHPLIYSLLCGLLTIDPRDRMTLSELLDHAWLKTEYFDDEVKDFCSNDHKKDTFLSALSSLDLDCCQDDHNLLLLTNPLPEGIES